MAMLDIARLSAMVWQPLAKATNDAKSLIISPDGGLWLYPWEALVRPGSELSCREETNQLSGHRAGKSPSRARGKPARARRSSPTPTMMRNRLKPSRGIPTPGARQRDHCWGRRPPKGLLGNATVRPLSGAAAEVDAFTAALRSYVAAAPNVYRGKQASEGEFKKLQSPRVLVISTHGFFLPEPSLRQYAADRRSQAAVDSLQCLPFLRAGRKERTDCAQSLAPLWLGLGGRQSASRRGGSG